MADTPRVTVPVEPTEAMLDAWHKAVEAGIFSQTPHPDYMREAYLAMLSAAPAPEGGAANDDRLTYSRLARALSCHPTVMVVERSDPTLELTAKSLEDTLEEVLPLAAREEAPAEAGERERLIETLCQSETFSVNVCGEGRWLAGEIVDMITEALRYQPPAREDAQPVDDKPLTKAQRLQLFHILRSGSVEVSGSWSVFDALATRGLIYISEYRIGFYRARATEKALAAYGSELGINALATTHPVPVALREAVEALETIAGPEEQEWEKDPDLPPQYLPRWSAGQCRNIARQALAALQAEQGAK